jgi:hypothetical protein
MGRLRVLQHDCGAVTGDSPCLGSLPRAGFQTSKCFWKKGRELARVARPSTKVQDGQHVGTVA